MGAGLGRIATGFATICVAQVTVAVGALRRCVASAARFTATSRAGLAWLHRIGGLALNRTQLAIAENRKTHFLKY